MLLQIDGTLSAPRGFRAAGEGAYALLTCGLPAVCAGVYGKNRIKSAPSRWTSFLTEQNETAQALFVCGNISGTCIGDEGYKGAVEMAQSCAAVLGLPAEKVLLAAAGADGVPFSKEEADSAASTLSRSLSEGEGAAAVISGADEGIEIAVEFDIGDKKARIGGAARKESAFAVFTTDVAISKEMLQRALSAIAEETFFMLAPFGTRPSDSILCFASGMAGNGRIQEEDSDYAAFCVALRHVAAHLTKRAAGECAVEITVQNAADKQAAMTLAKKAASVGEKTSFADLLFALGETDIPFDPDLIDINVRTSRGSAQLLRNGQAVLAEGTEEILDTAAVAFTLDIKNGNASATAWRAKGRYR